MLDWEQSSTDKNKGVRVESTSAPGGCTREPTQRGRQAKAANPTLILYPHFPRSSINLLEVEATRDKLIIDTISGSQMDSGSYAGSLKTIRIGYTGDKDGFSSSKPRYQSLQRFTTQIREVASPHSPDRATLDGK